MKLNHSFKGRYTVTSYLRGRNNEKHDVIVIDYEYPEFINIRVTSDDDNMI